MRKEMERTADEILGLDNSGVGSYYNAPWDSFIIQFYSAIDAAVKNIIQDLIDRFPEETGGSRRSYEMGVVVLDALESQLEDWKKFFAGAEYRGNKPYKEKSL